MKSSKHKGQLYRSLQAMIVFPLLVMGLLITAFNYTAVVTAMHNEVKTQLKNIAQSVVLTYDLLYPGDYHLVGTDSYTLYKGDQKISMDYSIIDAIKADTQAEVTLFYEDIRVLTTIEGKENERIVGTVVNNKVVKDILETGIPHFYNNTTINGKQYFAYYTPLFNADNNIIGMVYAGKPCSEVDNIVRTTVFPIIIIALFSMIVVSLISSSYTHKLIISLQKIRVFLSKVSTGSLSEELDVSVLRRNDELSEMGYSALHMQRSIRNLVEQDTLTELYNRRFADNRLKQTQTKAYEQGNSFTVAIGDIDLFKIINDTYGHECGDLVLNQVAAVLRRNMMGKGFVARWGGEEFLFVHDGFELDKAITELQNILQQVGNLTITYDNQPIHVTMTFGVAQGGKNTNIKELLQQADAKLYKGKDSGRNQVVS